MTRRILPIEQESEKIDLVNLKKDNEEFFNDNEVVISSQDMERLFNLWDGKSALSIDIDLGSKIKRYLEFEEEIKPYRQKIAKKIYEPYLLAEGISNYECRAELYVNNKFIGNSEVLTDFDPDDCSECHVVGMKANIFKKVLIVTGCTGAIGIANDDDSEIDIFLYVSAQGGTIDCDKDTDYGDNTFFTVRIFIEN